MPRRALVRRRARLLAGLGVLVALAGGSSRAAAQTPPATTTPGPTTTIPAIPLATSPPTTVPPTTVPADASGRQWLTPIPTGCDAPALPDVVFVGTLLETGTPSGSAQVAETETGRFHIDQVRAGSVDRYSFGGVVDVRFGIDTKYLETDQQYLVGARLDPATAVLVSKVREPEPLFGGDEVIGAAESDVNCPVLDDPVRTMHVDGTSIDSGVIAPLNGAKHRVLRAFVLPLAIAFGIVFALATLRWIITGLGHGVGSVVRTASEPREVRAATRTRPRVRQD